MKDTFKTFPSKEGVSPVEWCILAEEWKERVEEQLQEINLCEWLDQDYPKTNNGKEWHSFGANFIETLRLFINKEILGEKVIS